MCLTELWDSEISVPIMNLPHTQQGHLIWMARTQDNQQSVCGTATSKPDWDWHTGDSHSCISRFWFSWNLMGPPNCVSHQTNVITVDKHQAKANKTASVFFFYFFFVFYFLFLDERRLTELRCNSLTKPLIHIKWDAVSLQGEAFWSSSEQSHKCQSAPPTGKQSNVSCRCRFVISQSNISIQIQNKLKE